MAHNHIVLTEQNLSSIASRLKNGEGRILIVGPGMAFDYYDQASLSLYDRPRLSRSSLGVSVSTHRDIDTFRGERWQTGWERDRHYLLRKIPRSTGSWRWDDARELFDRLSIGPFEFKIGFEAAVSQGFSLSRQTVIFIPRGFEPDEAFRFALDLTTRELNHALAKHKDVFRFNPQHVASMVRYALQDLRDSKVFKKNVQAGMDADVMVGI